MNSHPDHPRIVNVADQKVAGPWAAGIGASAGMQMARFLPAPREVS